MLSYLFEGGIRERKRHRERRERGGEDGVYGLV